MSFKQFSEVEKTQLVDMYEWALEEGLQFFFIRVFREHHLDKKKEHYPFVWRWEAEFLKYDFDGTYKSGRKTADSLLDLRAELGALMHNKEEVDFVVDEELGCL